jgi:pyruvate,orthophosphate dikinase
MVKEKLITEKEAIMRVPPSDLTSCCCPSSTRRSEGQARRAGKGLPASPGAAVGKLAFTADEAVERARQGREGHPGPQGDQPRGRRRHARGGGHPDQHRRHDQPRGRGGPRHGASAASPAPARSAIDEGKKITVGGKTFTRNDVISIDGTTGEVMRASSPPIEPKLSGDFARSCAGRQVPHAGVRTNADTPADAKRARDFGAEGIGLCRTEHMFFEGDRIMAMREMILPRRGAPREKALAKLLPYPAQGLRGHLHRDEGPARDRAPARPAAARVPAARGQRAGEMAKRWACPRRRSRQRVDAAARGEPDARSPRLPLASPIPRSCEMQVRAITEAAIERASKKGKATHARDHDPADRHGAEELAISAKS